KSAPDAGALLWLTPQQTAGKKLPFLFSQGESIENRSWIPTQDSPGIRQSWEATIHVPAGMTTVMSAPRIEQPITQGGESIFNFRMDHSVAPYMIAIAVGDLAFKPLGPRTGVWAEPATLPAAANELADTEKMVAAAEKLYGPYQWGRYDVLVLPPSFPFGGMENPTLTFATPTFIAGDKSLVSLIAHELAHSWSGNLATNATWNDFWLNEGFTVYVERRILEKVYGRPRAEMEAVLGRQELEREMATVPAQDQILHIDLKGRDPDDGVTSVPYEKGALLLGSLEQKFGRERFDKFLREYFNHFTFQSITTGIFVDYLKKHLPGAETQIPLAEWLTQPGIPASAPRPASDAFTKVSEQAKRWASGVTPAAK